MLLNLSERSMVLNLLPEKGNLLTLRTVDETRKMLALSERERDNWNVQEDRANQRITWDPNIDTTVEVPLSAKATVMITDRLQDLDRRNALELGYLGLWSKFVESSDST